MLLLILASCSEQGPNPLARSLIVITIDTLRADHLSAWGHDRETSPELDAYLQRGARFRWGFSAAPRTAPSHASIMTGLYPSFHSVGNENGRFRLEESFDTLAEHCRTAGMRTAAIISNPVLKRGLGLDQGFEIYDDEFPDAVPTRDSRIKNAARAVERAQDALEDFGDEPFFLWLHVQDPHGPYMPKGEFSGVFEGVPSKSVSEELVLEVGETQAGRNELPNYQVYDEERRLSEYVRRYNEEIRYTDAMLGKLFRMLDELDLADQTFVAVTADHGEAFGEDEYYCAHGQGTGIDQTHVPLGFVGPGISAQRTLLAPVSNLDVFATALDALGLEGADRMQSTSLLPHLVGESEPDHSGYAESVTQRAVFSPQVYMRMDRVPTSNTAFWSAIEGYTRAPRIPLGEPRWSRLTQDGPEPLESAQPPQDHLLEALTDYAQRADDFAPKLRQIRKGEMELSEADRADLRAMGYMD